ncbi:MAG: PEP-CTERM sorting domain-containing protein [Luteolibacter sp.]
MMTFAVAATIDVTPGNNNVPISQVTYLIGGLDVVQSSQASGVEHTADTSVNLKSVRITDGAVIDLPFFNTAGAKAVVSPQLAGLSGIGVFNNNVTTLSNAGSAAYAAAVAGTATDTNLRNFSFQDFVTPASPPKSGFDYDLLFKYALNLSDYLLVSERWGNSSFLVTPLDVNGLPYSGSNTLRLGGAGLATGLSYSAYDWNTGYSAASNVPSQAQAMTIASVAKFFPSGQAGGPVYGVRVEISNITPTIEGEADTKIIGISNDTFSNNPVNPQLVPEPSAFLMCLLGGVVMFGVRKRQHP